MLRTLLFVVALVWLLVASLIAFVPIATGEPDAGSLTVTCDRNSVPRGVDTLIRCTYTAGNESGRDWMDARLTFRPLIAGPTPDRYFFFRFAQGESVLPNEPSQTTYDFPQIRSGSTAEIRFGVIVNSSRTFGVAPTLIVGNSGQEIAQVPQSWNVFDAATDPPLYGSLVPMGRDESGDVSPSVASWLLVVRNTLGEDLPVVRAEVFAPDYGVTVGLDDPQRVTVTSIAGGLGPIVAGGFIQRELRVETRGRCAYAQPAILLSAVTGTGETVTGAILPENGATLNCQTLEAPGVPATGHGLSPEGAATPLRPVPLALAVSGAVLALLGAGPVVRRLKRGSRRSR